MGATAYSLTPADVVATEWAALRAAYDDAKRLTMRPDVWARAWAATLPLATITANIDALWPRVAKLAPDGEHGRAVASGSMTLDRWRAIANAVLDGLEAQAGYISEGVSWARFSREVVTPTVERTTELAADVGTGLGAVAVVALVAYVWLAVRR